tara:strand:+ start:906 stop:1172 length:267 start_codon:yes stop_codon:yes gene_type:complete
MSKINESLLKNLVSAVTGIAVASKVTNTNYFKKKSLSNKVKKMVANDPELKKSIADMDKVTARLEKDLEKKLQKLSPEARKRLDGLLG